MSRYIEIVFKHKLRLLVLAVLVPLVASALSARLMRSYDGVETVWVDDPGAFGQSAPAAVGYNNYLTPAQNAVQRISNLIGSQGFNDELSQELLDRGIVHSDRERAAVIASLNQLSVTPGGAASSASAASGAASDHTIAIHYTCSTQALCYGVLPLVLDVYRQQYAALKANAAATARAVYLPRLQAAQSDLTAAIAARDKYKSQLEAAYEAQAATARAKHLPPPAPVTDDSTLASLQYNVDVAQHEVDADTAELQAIDNLTAVSVGISNDMYVIDGPRIQPGLYGINGFRKDNLKTIALIWAACLAMAIAYLVMVAQVDRSVSDPDAIRKRFGGSVTVIPDYTSSRGRRKVLGRVWGRA